MMMTKQRIAAAIYYRFIKKGWFDFLNYELYRLQANRFEKCKNKPPFFLIFTQLSEPIGIRYRFSRTGTKSTTNNTNCYICVFIAEPIK